MNIEAMRASEIKDKEIQILTQNKEYQSLRAVFLIISIILALIIAIISFIFFIKKKKDNQKLLEHK